MNTTNGRNRTMDVAVTVSVIFALALAVYFMMPAVQTMAHY